MTSITREDIEAAVRGVLCDKQQDAPVGRFEGGQQAPCAVEPALTGDAFGARAYMTPVHTRLSRRFRARCASRANSGQGR